MINIKPALIDEYERLEAELERYYQSYVEKCRNLDYLGSIMKIYNKKEDEEDEGDEDGR